MAAQQHIDADIGRREFMTLGALLFGAAPLTAAAQVPVRVVTEEFPPYNYTENDRITGMGTEVVEAVLKEAGVRGQIQSLPWARAYETAINVPSVLIYSIVRTAERDKLFKWVGVIASSEYYLFSLSDRNLHIQSLEDARHLQIGAVSQSVGEQFLLSRGFVKGKNLQSSAKNELNYEKLRLGRVDLWILNRITAFHLVRQAGQDPEKVLHMTVPIPELSAQSYYMAFGNSTPDATVAKFRTALETVTRDGRLEQLQRKWQ